MKKIFTTMLLAALVFACTAGAAAEKKEIKYSLAIYHYNLEYVAGDTAIENKIITESLDPMLDLFLKHPEWGADFEMQGYMVLETAKRYPEIFNKLKTLVDRDQIALVSFHYADQLFLAYPAHDMEWSVRLNDMVFDIYGLQKSGTVFSQEGQGGEGMARFMLDHGFKTLAYPKNLYRHAHGDYKAMPYYRLNGLDTIFASLGVDYEDENVIVKTAWSYMNDAELLPTGGETPYYENFSRDAEAVAEYEAKLLDHEKQGYIVGTIDDYIEAVKAAGVQPSELLPVIDGDWQPGDTENLFRWMGNYLGGHERDNEILTRNVAVRHRLVAAEQLVAYLKSQGHDTSEMDAKIVEAWRNQAHATVSDSTGWTPFPIEIKYSEDYSAAASLLVDEIVADAKKLTGAAAFKVKLQNGKVDLLDKPEKENELPEVDCPVDFELKGYIKKEAHRCLKVADNVTMLEYKFRTTNSTQNNLRLEFPRTVDYLLYSPGLWEETYVKYPVSAFNPEHDEFYLPCSNGLIAIGENTFLVKKTDTVHVTWRFGFDEPTVSLPMARPPSATYEWVVYIVQGTPEQAVMFANSVNVYPKVILE